MTSELTTKRLELIRDLVPSASVVAVLVNPRSPESRAAIKRHRAGRGRGRASGFEILNASSDRDIDAAFATLVKPRDAALLVDERCVVQPAAAIKFVALAARHAIPTIYDRRA